MTDQEFVSQNRGTRGFLALLVFLIAIAVGIETWSRSWFFIALMAGALVRLAGVAAILDKIDAPRNEQASKMSETRLK